MPELANANAVNAEEEEATGSLEHVIFELTENKTISKTCDVKISGID